MPCTSYINACSSSTMHYETNLVEENKELQSLSEVFEQHDREMDKIKSHP